MSEGKSAEELKELGNQAFAKKDYDDAIRLYSDAIKKDPSNHVYFSNRSASYGGKEEWQASADDAKECIRLDPTFVKGYYRLATAHIELKDFDAAMATIRQGLTVDKENPQLTKQLRLVKQLKKAAERSPPQQSAGPLLPNGMGRQLDEATSRELQDLQLQRSQQQREFHTVNAMLVKMQRDLKASELTQDELKSVPDEANCFRGIGKVFLKTNKPGAVEHMEKRMEEQKKTEGDLTQKLEYLERRIKSTEKNIEELLSST